MKGNKMKFAKLLSVVLFAVVLFTSVSYGQSIPSGTGRYEALGYNPFIKDASIDINRNPAWTTVYRNYAFGDLGRTASNDQYELSDQFGAANFGVSKDLALGIVANKFEDSWTDFTSYGNNTYGIQRPVVPLKLTLGWQASPKFALGIAPYFAGWSSDFDSATTTQKWSSNVLGGTIGVLAKLDGGWIEGDIDVKTHKYKYDRTFAGTNTVDENEGGLSMNVYTRAFFTINKSMGLNLVPYLSFSMFNWNPLTTPLVTGASDPTIKHMSFMGGLGINMPVLDNGLIAGGLSFGYNSFEYKVNLPAAQTQTQTIFVLPKINMGIEWPFTDWLTGRLGYQRSISSTKFENLTTATVISKGTVVSDPTQTITAGLGFHFNRFSIDGSIGERLFKNGINLVSGKDNDMFGMLSASYYFGK